MHDYVDYYRRLLDAGKLSLGGPFLDDSGGMMISVPGASLEEMKNLAEADPAVKVGLLQAIVRPWLVGMKAD